VICRNSREDCRCHYGIRPSIHDPPPLDIQL
jgi:hypothetical protein